MQGAGIITSGHPDVPSGNAACVFTIPFQQTGTIVTGAGVSAFCGSVYSVSGTVSGNSFSGTFVATDGVTTSRTTFVATVSGNSITAMPAILTVDGLTGKKRLS